MVWAGVKPDEGDRGAKVQRNRQIIGLIDVTEGARSKNIQEPLERFLQRAHPDPTKILIISIFF